MTRIAVLPGDGIGPEVTAVARNVLEAAGLEATWNEHPVGWSCWRAEGDALPPATLHACRETDAVLFGAITSKPGEEAEAELDPALRNRGLRYQSPIVRLRRELGLHANVRPVRGRGLDLTIFRENTEDVYAGFEAAPVPTDLADVFPGLPAGDGTAVTLRLTTHAAVERICRAAARWCKQQGVATVHLVDKANVMRKTGGLVRRVARDTFETHGIAMEELHIDAACALLVRDPARFRCIVATNLFGDILSDLAAELAGGLPTAASANLGARHALFEPVHGSAPDIAGTGTADPRGAVLAGAMLARHLGQTAVADAVEAALADVPHAGRTAPTQARILERLRVVHPV